MHLPHRYNLWFLMLALVTWCAAGASASAQSAPAATQTASASCPQDDSGLKLPAGFCATIFADGIGHARHLVVAPNGVVYVNTWSGRYYGNDTPHAGGFLVALQDTTGKGKADVEKRFGETVQSGGAGGTGIGLYKDGLYAEINDKIVRYALPAGSIVPQGPSVPVVTGLPLTGDHPMHPFTIDRDGSLYIEVATPTNACQVKNRIPHSPGISPCTELETRGGVWRYDANKANQAFSPAGRFATGIRNAEGFGIDAADHIFVTQHGRDQLHANWPELYKPEEEATQPAEELLLLKRGGDYGWPECYYDGMQGKLVLAPEYGGDGGKKVGTCATKSAPIAAFPAHWAPNGMALYNKQQFPAHYRNGVFIAFHGSWDRAPYPQAGYNVVFQALAGDHASGRCEIFADGFAGAVEAPGQAAHRPSGVAIGPDGALFVSDDIRGRIYRIVYQGGSGSSAGAANVTPCPSASASAGQISANDAKPPEGTHPDAGRTGGAANLPVPAGATQQMVALGERIFLGQVGGATCTGCHGADAKGTPLGPDLTDTQWLWGDGSFASIAKTITNGVPQPKQYRSPMPPMGGAQLTSDQVSALAAYIWALSHRSAAASSTAAREPSALQAYDLKTRKPKGRYVLPTADAFCNDIAVGADGATYVTYSNNMQVDRLARGSRRLTVWAGDGRFGPQGGVLGRISILDNRIYVNTLITSKTFSVPIDSDGKAGTICERSCGRLTREPVGFGSSVAALREFRESPQRFDIVLTDESMPELAGTALAVEIARLRPDLPIVLMSGFAGAQLQERARALGIRELLRKPLRRKDIADCFGRVLPA